MKKTAMVALGFVAVIAAAPAFAQCPGHSGPTTQTQSTPAPVAQSTPPASAPVEESNVVLTQSEQVPLAETAAQ